MKVEKHVLTLNKQTHELTNVERCFFTFHSSLLT